MPPLTPLAQRRCRRCLQMSAAVDTDSAATAPDAETLLNWQRHCARTKAKETQSQLRFNFIAHMLIHRNELPWLP
eukprot:2921267-Pleurochrysis_carterae.AAC.1